MRVPARALLLLAPLLACAPPAPPEPEPLVYRAPEPAELSFESTDTTNMTLGSPVGDIAMEMANRMTLRTTFTPAETGIRVEMEVADLDARVSNPMFGAVTLDESQVRGTFVFLLGPRGEVEVLETPEMPGSAGGLLEWDDVAHALFPSLPPEPPRPGDTWTDTIVSTAGLDELETTSTLVRTYTLVRADAGPAGDLLEVRAEGATTSTLEGSAEGVEMTQEMQGTEEGTLLLDPRTALPVSAEWRRTFSGTIDVPEAGMSGMEITLTTRSTLRRTGVEP